MSNGKVIIIHLTVGSIKKILLHKMSCFPEAYTRSKSKTKVELDLSSCATKSDLERSRGVDTSDFAKKADLASLKTTVEKLDKLDVDRLKSVPVDLKKVSYVEEKKVDKEYVYDKLYKKVNAIQTTDTINLLKKSE